MSFLKRMVGERKEKATEPLKRREKTIGNYVIIKTIGEGRYGKVKLAEHLVTRKKVAVKIMKKAQMEAADLARIKRELRVMTVLDHPNIVKLYQVIDTPETTCIVMEFCSGGDLYDYISTYRRLAVPNALKIFRQIVAGLLYCHQHLVIHRDIKPENILLTEDLQVKIGDFGFSRSFNPHAAMETACGSLTYAAPEVIAGKGYLGPKADVWSLGCVLYVLLTGALPFDGANDFEVIPKIRKGKFQDSPFLNEDNMRELITCMLNPDPNKRANLEDIQKHPWTWSDKSMLAMLVRPFSNALTSRRKMAVHQGFDWAESMAMPSPRRERSFRKPPLSREISSLSDSELNDPTLPKDVRPQTRTRGKSMSDRNDAHNKLEPLKRKRKSGETGKEENSSKADGGEKTKAGSSRKDPVLVYGHVYDSRSILGEYDEMDLVAMMAERMDDREMAELEHELQMEIEAERARRKSSSLSDEAPDDERQSDSKELATRTSGSGESGEARRSRSRSVGSRKGSAASRNSLGSSSSSSSSSGTGERSRRGSGVGSVNPRIRSGSESGEKDGSSSSVSSHQKHSSGGGGRKDVGGKRRIRSEEGEIADEEESNNSNNNNNPGTRARSRTVALKDEAGSRYEEPDKRGSKAKRGVGSLITKRDSKEEAKEREKSSPPSPSSSTSSTSFPSPLNSPSTSQVTPAGGSGITGRDRAQTVGGATKENIMSMLGFRPRTRDQRSQSVFEAPTLDAEVVADPVTTRERSRSRSHSMSAAEEVAPPDDPSKKGKWKKGSKRSPLTNSQPASPSDGEDEDGAMSPNRDAVKKGTFPSPASSIIERYARTGKKRASSPAGGLPTTASSGSGTNNGDTAPERKPTMLSRLKNITKKTPKNQQHLVVTRKRSFSTEDAINLAKEKILASREDIDELPASPGGRRGEARVRPESNE